MPPDKLASIFEPFSSSNSNVRGNGVGLSICKKICEQMEGRIVVESKEGHGTTFTFNMKAFQARSVENYQPPKKAKKNKPKKKSSKTLEAIKEEQDEGTSSESEEQEPIE